MRALALTIALLITAAASGQNPAQKPDQKQELKSGLVRWNMSRKDVDLLIRNVPQSNSLRLAQLERSFSDLECKGPRLTEESVAEGKNLLCTFPGVNPTPKPGANPATPSGIMLFIAHYEHEGSGQSAVDNWSGAIMLPFLYHALSATPRNHTFIFAEVDGAAGAKALFDSLTPDQRHSLQGVVALDALGLGPAQFYISPNDTSGNPGWSWLSRQLFQAAAGQQVDTPLIAIPGRWFQVDTTREFRHHGVPSILVHSVTWNTRQIPGSANDTTSAINGNVYFTTYNLLADYIVHLDQPPPSTTPNAASSPSRGRR